MPNFLQNLLGSYPVQLLGQAAQSPLGQGIGRSLVPLAIGGIAQAFAGSRDKGRVFSPYLQAATGQILDSLDRPAREQQQLTSLLGQLGQLSTSAPTPGATPFGTLAGLPLFRDARTLAQANPQFFAGTSPESRVQFQEQARPPLAQGELPPLSPEKPDDALLQLLGNRPNTPQSQGALGDFLFKRNTLEQENRQRQQGLETLTRLSQGREGQAGQGQPRMRYNLDARGNITASLLPPAPERAPSFLEKYLTEDQARRYAQAQLTRAERPPGTGQERQPRAPSRYELLGQLRSSGQISDADYIEAIKGRGSVLDDLEGFIARQEIKERMGNDRAAIKDELDQLKEEEKTITERMSGGKGVPPVPRALMEKVRKGQPLSEEEIQQIPFSYGLLSGDPVTELRGDVERLDQLKQERQRVRKSGTRTSASTSSTVPPARSSAKSRPPGAPAPVQEYDLDPTTGRLIPRQ